MTVSRRAWGTTVVAILMFTMLGGYIWSGVAVASVWAVRNQFRLPQVASDKPIAPDISREVLNRALLAAPVSQPIYNAILVADAKRAPASVLKPKLAVLRKLGWRDPTSVQNMIANALVTNDLGDIAEAGDALLRQERLVSEATLLMVLLEAYPDTWRNVASRLARNVAWRYTYLERAGSLNSVEQFDGRYRTLSAMQAGGDRLKRQELAPFVSLMTEKGRIGDARKLWLAHVGAKPAVLLDPDFDAALKQSLLALPTTPFEWRFEGGVGYVADVSADGLRGARVSIQWDGRSVPVFLSQRTAAKPGRYRVAVKVEGEPAEFARRIGFRLRCGDLTAAFDKEAIMPGNVLSLAMQDDVRCEFPVLEIFGKIQEPRRAVDVAFTAVRMERVQ